MGYNNYNNHDGEDRTKSKYNSAISQLYRMDELWRDSHRHSRAGNLKEYNSDLDRVWLELAGDLKPVNKKDRAIILEYKDFNFKIAELNGLLTMKRISLSNFSEKLYQLLMEKELFLRRMQNELGKGTAYEDEMEDDWE